MLIRLQGITHRTRAGREGTIDRDGRDLWLFDRLGAWRPDSMRDLPDDLLKGSDGGRYLCAGCGESVTTVAATMEVGGGHEHEFMNPGGYLFHIGCFSNAPGCREDGALTAEYSWFAGYRWRYAMCGGCSGHLGWTFVGPTRFFGLILRQLVLEPGH